MDVGNGLYMYDVVVKKFMFAISSPDEFLYLSGFRDIPNINDEITTCKNYIVSNNET